jgi:hypothetical protein
MKYKDLLLLLLTIIFVILSIFYIINVCNYNVKELFVTRYHTNVSSCEQGVLQSETLPSNDAKYTSEIMRNGGFIDDYNEKYNCNNNYSSYTSSYSDVKNRGLLLAYKCINIKPSELIIQINNNSILNINTYKITDSNLLVYNNVSQLHTLIDNIIKENITIFKNRPSNNNIDYIHFPIYVCISQAPFLNNDTEQLAVTDSNRGANNDNYIACSLKYIASNNRSDCSESQSMKAEYSIVFLGVKNNGDMMNDGEIGLVNENITLFRTILDLHNNNSKQCFLNCGYSDSSYSCGCLNKDNSYNNYNSRCITNDKQVDYSIVYFVNPYANNYSDDNYTPPTGMNAFKWYGGKM